MTSSPSSSRLEHEADKPPHPHGLDALMMKRLVSRSWEESRLLWRLAFPALLTEVFQFSIGFVTTAFVGHLGEVELAAVSVVENILDSSAYGVLVRLIPLPSYRAASDACNGFVCD
jgi:MATE family multidrug resistance protein